MTKDDHNIWNFITRSVNKLRGAPASVTAGPMVPAASLPRVEYFHPVLDLHGYSTNQAYYQTTVFLEKAQRAGVRKVMVITGKSGDINKEFSHWLTDRHYISRVTAKNDGGAWDIWLKKSTSTLPR